MNPRVFRRSKRPLQLSVANETWASQETADAASESAELARTGVADDATKSVMQFTKLVVTPILSLLSEGCYILSRGKEALRASERFAGQIINNSMINKEF